MRHSIPFLRRYTLTIIAAVCALPLVASAAEPLSATDTDTLRSHLNENVEVKGTPTVVGQSKQSTVGYVNFGGPHQGVALVFFFTGTGAPAKSVEDLKAYVGKPIIVSGRLTEYKGDLQIKVETADQIKPAP